MNERDMNRRRFLKLGMAGLGGAWVGLNGQTAAAMMGGGMWGNGGAWA